MATVLADMLKSVTDLWLAQIELCKKAKKRDFDEVADEIMRYIGKRYDGLSSRGENQSDTIVDDYPTVVNYTQLFVDTLTPDVFARVPNRLATPARPQIPAELESEVPDIVAMQSGLRKRDTLLSYELQSALNWFPKVYNLSREGEMTVREGLAIGRGCLWLEMIDGPTGEIPASMSDTTKNLLIDADTKQSRDAGFIIRIREQVAWKIADLYGEDVKEIRSSAASNLSIASSTANRSTTNPESDLATYYEIWSVMGLGEKLVGASDDMTQDGVIRDVLKSIGPYVHFAVMPGIDHPLGMLPDRIESVTQDQSQLMAMLQAMLEWPIKTYGNSENPWPVFLLDLKPQSDKPWPKPILEAALPLQRFIDDVYQSLLLRAKKAGKDILLTSLAIDEDVIEAIKGLEDLPIVKTSEASMKSLKDMIDFLSFPEINKDVFEILRLADAAFREITGLDPSNTGSAPRAVERSAKASQMRQAGLGRRPSEYADKVEAFLSAVGMGEAIAARMLVAPETIAPLFGEQVLDGATGLPATPETVMPIYGKFTKFWIESVHTDDPYIAASECEYTVEAGSGRRRNKQLQQENAQQIYTMLSQQIFSLGTTLQNLEPYLMLVRMVGDAYEMPVEPIIEKVREALAIQQQQAIAPQNVISSDGTQQSGGDQSSNLPSQWMSAAGGPKKMNLPPPPGAM